jgi:S-disulfanyl-L-cysteine oxidoreductase SoxD
VFHLAVYNSAMRHNIGFDPRIWSGAGIVLAALTLAAYAAAQDSTPSTPPIWAGVFSAEQAERGRAVVLAHCTQCHGQTRSLSGDVFMLHWEGHDLGRLFRKIKETMPPGRATQLTDAEKIDALAYILQQNGFPAGVQDLAPEDAPLQSIRVIPRDGPRPMRNGSVVQLSGCLSPLPNAGWQLTDATEPAAAALDNNPPTDAAVAEAESGHLTFQLLSVFPSPAPHAGRKVFVKGLLIRNPSGDRVNVVSLVPVGSEPCH